MQKKYGNEFAWSINKIKGSKIKFWTGLREWQSPKNSEKTIGERRCPQAMQFLVGNPSPMYNPSE